MAKFYSVAKVTLSLVCIWKQLPLFTWIWRSLETECRHQDEFYESLTLQAAAVLCVDNALVKETE
jgi:hypothetical protein